MFFIEDEALLQSGWLTSFVMLHPTRLVTLAAVDDHGGVVGAAAALHLTPSAVSQQLRQLKREAGVGLLDRSGRQIRLTEAGARLAARGRTIGREVVLAADDLADWSDADARPVEIATFQTVICQMLAPLMGAGVLRDAGLDLRIVELEGPPALDALHAGRVDVVMTEELLGTVQPHGDRSAPVTRLVVDDRYRVIVPAGWAVDDTSPDRLRADLVARPWIGQVPGSAGGAMLADLERRWSFSARLVHICDEYVSAVALAEAGLGATLAPHLAVPAHVSGAESRTVRFLDGAPDLGMRRVRALCRPSRRPVAAVDRLLQVLAERARVMGLRAQLLGHGESTAPLVDH